MRQRLATSWRSPQVQQQQKTKRTDKETEAEATRGYQLLTSLVAKRLEKEQTWKLLMLQGSALFDWAEFDYGRQVELATYTKRRDESFDLFPQGGGEIRRRAADDEGERADVARLPAVVQRRARGERSGRTDAAGDAVANRKSTASALRMLAIPGEQQADKHMESFGKWLSDGSQSLKPELKHRFLKAGLEVAKDHPAAEGARKLVQYYADLLTEVELFAQLEGDPTIGHKKPFGLHLSIRHTQAVGRESGGFNKYLTNQQPSRSGYYGYSGPDGPVNYRDDFEKKIREALVERFDIKAITWFDEKVESRPFGKPGWRETPLAFVLLQPKDAQRRQGPAGRRWTSISTTAQSKVILPVSSQVILVDAQPENRAAATDGEGRSHADPRPARRRQRKALARHQGDRRKACCGDLDVAARRENPRLQHRQDRRPGPGREPAWTSRATSSKPLTERSWLVSLSAAKDALTQAKAGAASFKFPQPKSDEIKVAYKQYADADVADVDPQVAVSGLPLGTSRRWMYVTIAAIVLIVAASRSR